MPLEDIMRMINNHLILQIKTAIRILMAVVVMSGFEPPTHGFSVRCSTT